MPLLESTLGAILRYSYYFIITAIRSLEERFAHACTLKWRFACLREAASAKAGHAGMALNATGGYIDGIARQLLLGPKNPR